MLSAATMYTQSHRVTLRELSSLETFEPTVLTIIPLPVFDVVRPRPEKAVR